MFNQTALNTEAALLRIKNIYEKKYKTMLSEYNAHLSFETLLEYFTGSCSLVVEMNSISEKKGKVEMIYMVDCHKTDFTNSDEEFEDFFEKRIYKPYYQYFKLNYLISDFKLGKKVFIKDTVASDAVVCIKISTELINLDINGHKLVAGTENITELRALLKCLSIGLGDI